MTLELHKVSDQIENDEADALRWVPIDQLCPEDIQSHGDILFQALRSATA